jgi:hypothetical protein
MSLVRQFFLAIIIIAGLLSCQNKEAQYEVFGEGFEVDSKIMSAKELDKLFDQLELEDTVEVVFSMKIDAVCQKKGCWMDVDLDNDAVARVTFLDYGFFVPLNAAGSEAIVKGKAFWKADTAAEKRHYAEDAGGSIEEIELDEDAYAPHIVATGVLIKK